MPNPVVHFEVNHPDGEKVHAFYADLFGWHVQAMPEMKYGFIDTHAGTRGINGGIGSPPDGTQVTMWYVEVDDLQATLDKAESLGGKTVMPIMEIPNVVTLAHFADPAGNRIGLVKADDSQDEPKDDGGTAVGWFEALGPEPKKLAAFYKDLFGWHINTDTEQSGDMEYHEIDTLAGGIHGGLGRSPDGKTPHTTVYARVDDVKVTLDKAESLGGKGVMGPMDVGDGTTVGAFTDPNGCVFGVYRQA